MRPGRRRRPRKLPREGLVGPGRVRGGWQSVEAATTRFLCRLPGARYSGRWGRRGARGKRGRKGDYVHVLIATKNIIDSFTSFPTLSSPFSLPPSLPPTHLRWPRCSTARPSWTPPSSSLLVMKLVLSRRPRSIWLQWKSCGWPILSSCKIRWIWSSPPTLPCNTNRYVLHPSLPSLRVVS